MPLVDPDEDSVTRFVVRHYAFDPVRHERRHVVIAAYDNEAEFLEHIDRLSAELRAREDRDPREHISGVVVEAGHARQWANARVIKSAIEHGVTPPPHIWDQAADDLPPGFGVSRCPPPDG